MYKSTKILDGFSTCFRQWRASDSHCSKLHGYSLKFEITFKSKNLDARNWVMDFGLKKTLKFRIPLDGFQLFNDWMKWMFDHTTVVASDDPFLHQFRQLDKSLINLRMLENVGCEKFAEVVFVILSRCDLPQGVSVESVKCIENDTNSATYVGE